MFTLPSDLVIDAWRGEDNEKMSANKFGGIGGDDASKERNFNVTGWGGPPPGETTKLKHSLQNPNKTTFHSSQP